MKGIVFLSVLIALAAVGVRVYFRFSTLLSSSPSVDYKNHQSCTPITVKEKQKEWFVGAEDFVILDDLLITGTDDRMLLWEISVPSKTPDGHLFLIDTHTLRGRVLSLLNFPEGTAFHPHGLFLLEEGTRNDVQYRLYVVNHAYERGGERIDVFKITGRSFNDVTALYMHSIIPPLFSSLTGTINSVIALSNSAIYFTQYRAFHDMPDGRDFHSQYVWGKVHGIGNLLDALVLEGWSNVWYCEFDGRQATGNVTNAECFKAYSGLNAPNGITRDDEGYIYVALPTQKTVEVFVREGDNKLTHIYSIPTGRSTDNLKFNREREVIHAASLDIQGYLQLVKEVSSTQERPKAVVDGGNINIKKVQGELQFTVKETHLVPGKEISGVAGSTMVGKRVFLGSWYAPGVLSCLV